MSKLSKHSQEYRDTAVQLAMQGEKPGVQVAKELGIDEHPLYSWLKVWKKQVSVRANKSATKPTSVEDELKELRRKNKQLEMEVEILTKAAAYLLSNSEYRSILEATGCFSRLMKTAVCLGLIRSQTPYVRGVR